VRTPRLLALAGVAGLVAAATVATTGAGASASYTVTTLHFAVTTGPTGSQPCDIVGDLYTPAKASSSHRVPAILTTNGFGGSKDDQAGVGKAFAARGYAVLSYSGLGFGGSGCKITLDDPDYDGRAASQLISYLGGAAGIAYTDAKHTTAAPRLKVVVHDARDHAGTARKYDPRVGMIGGSYGGGVQFAAASIDPRLDTIVPMITWNDLSYSLAPNNTGQSTGVSTTTPGATKLAWGLAFSGLGVADGAQGTQDDPSRLVPCPNFATFVCPALVTAGTTGYFQPDAVAALRHASVASFVKKVTVPTLLMQGENDTLFNLNESVATYRALKKQGTTVKMVWQSWGHSDSTPAPGELDLDNPNPSTQYETARIVAWFAHYLGGSKTSTGPDFAYFRDWVSYQGIATPAYATASAFPVGSAKTYYLSGSSQLATSTKSVTNGSQTFTTPPAGAPSSINPADVLGGYLPASTPAPPQADLPGTYASWNGATLTKPLDVAGSPVVRVSLQAPSAGLTQAAGPAGQLVLFAKVLDVGPDGKATLIHGLEAPIRVADASKPVTVTLPAIVHRFAAGHHVQLVVAGGSENYRGGLTPTPVTIASGTGQTLVLPAVG
jgi:predicted acyl esterase